MAIVSAAVLLAFIATVSAEGPVVCPGGSEMLSMVTDAAPKCFEGCPQLCTPIDKLVSDYLMDPSTDAIKAKVCAQKDPFRCLFTAANSVECGKFLAMGAQFGVTLPMSNAQLDAQCAALGGGNSPGFRDSNSTNSTEEKKDVVAAAYRTGGGVLAGAGILALTVFA